MIRVLGACTLCYNFRVGNINISLLMFAGGLRNPQRYDNYDSHWVRVGVDVL